MNPLTDADIHHVYERWHQSVEAQDLDGLMPLYARDAMLETPLAFAVQKSRTEGILNGSDAIRAFFDARFRASGNGLGRWYRTDIFFSNGRQLTWEYPRATPQGDQVDLVEFMDIADGRIVHHRVYWGWMGFKSLATMQASPGSVS